MTVLKYKSLLALLHLDRISHWDTITFQVHCRADNRQENSQIDSDDR